MEEGGPGEPGARPRRGRVAQRGGDRTALAGVGARQTSTINTCHRTHAGLWSEAGHMGDARGATTDCAALPIQSVPRDGGGAIPPKRRRARGLPRASTSPSHLDACRPRGGHVTFADGPLRPPETRSAVLNARRAGADGAASRELGRAELQAALTMLDGERRLISGFEGVLPPILARAHVCVRQDAARTAALCGGGWNISLRHLDT